MGIWQRPDLSLWRFSAFPRHWQYNEDIIMREEQGSKKQILVVEDETLMAADL